MTRIEKLGALGENIIVQRYGGIKSDNPYDMEKDLTMPDGTKVEVKTQGRYNKANCFVVDSTPTNNQIRKCVSVDRLIFIEPGRNHKIRIFECVDRNYKVRNIRPGRESYCFDIATMNLVEEWEDKQLWSEIVKLTATDPKWFV